MNPHLNALQAYPFEKLRVLFDSITAPSLSPIALSIGEPKHQSPAFVSTVISQNLDKLSNYPTTKGIPELRQAISSWACQRFHLPALDPETQILPVNAGQKTASFQILTQLAPTFGSAANYYLYAHPAIPAARS